MWRLGSHTLSHQVSMTRAPANGQAARGSVWFARSADVGTLFRCLACRADARPFLPELSLSVHH